MIARGDFIGKPSKARNISFRQTASGGSCEWRKGPELRFVITFTGMLEFETKWGATISIRSGNTLIAQDNRGSGHKWRLIGKDPWRRARGVVWTIHSSIDGSRSAGCSLAA